MMLVHHTPAPLDFSQTHGQAEIERLALAAWIDASALA
jgi:hypothetical protein